MEDSLVIMFVFVGILVGALAVLISWASIDSLTSRDKKIIELTVRRIAKADAVSGQKVPRTIEEYVNYRLKRPVTVSDLEYAHSLYKGYVEEEERLHKERLEIRDNFYRTVDEYRDSKQHLLK